MVTELKGVKEETRGQEAEAEGWRSKEGSKKMTAQRAASVMEPVGGEDAVGGCRERRAKSCVTDACCSSRGPTGAWGAARALASQSIMSSGDAL